MSTVRAVELLFGGAAPTLRGAGSRVLLIDAAEVGEAESAWSASDSEVASRRRSLITDAGEALPGGPLGVAPGATVTSFTDPEVFLGTLEPLIEFVRQHGPFDVVVFCRPLAGDWSPAAEAQLSSLATRSLLLAVERDGQPAHADLVTVGSGAGAVLPTFSSTTFVAARAPNGDLGHLPLAEASVALAAGAAALLAELMRSVEQASIGLALRGALIAAWSRKPNPDGWVGAIARGAPVVFSASAHARLRLALREAPLLAAVHPGRPAAQWWFTPVVRLTLTADLGPATEGGERWAYWSPAAGHPGTATIGLSSDREDDPEQIVVAGWGFAAEPEVVRSKKKKPLIVVGLAASHDASACVMRDGQMLAAIQLERLTRHKHDGRAFLHTRQAVDYCLAAAGLRPRDVDLFAFNCMPLAPSLTGLSLPSHDASFHLFDPFSDRAVFVSHHLCHAYGAYWGSGFERSTVLVCDGSGGTTAGRPDVVLRGPQLAEYLASSGPESKVHALSAYVFGPTGHELVEREFGTGFNPLSGHSHLGEIYASASEYVFGDWQEGSGKLMGLAPYGEPDRFGPSLLARDANGYLQFTGKWKNRYREVLDRGDPLHHADFAARIQRDLELALVDRVRTLVARTGEGRVAYSGGVALNSVANNLLRQETGASALYVMPASNDAGTAVGAAVAAVHLETGRLTPQAVETDAFGYPYQRRDVDFALKRFAPVVQTRPVDLPDVVDRLVNKQVIGWFEGGSEFGPRALGQRSLLASASDRETWLYINRRIKFREDFRPFAPMVPEELAHEFFELDEPCPFMLRVVKVRPQYRERLGAVTHVDGSARVQTVSRRLLPRIHALLCAFGERTGTPVLVNTSLNVRGEPLIETPEQALEMLLATHLDAVVFGGETLVEPRSFSTPLDRGTVLSLPPKTHLESNATRAGRTYFLMPEARGKKGYELPEWAFELLWRVDGTRSWASLVNGVEPERRADADKLLESFVELRLLLRGDAASASVSASQRVTTGAAAAAEVTGLLADETPLLGVAQRVCTADQTIARVRRKSLVLGIDRVADVTDYDHLGVPVVSCIRPFVDDADITCTQGKGLTLEDATASALMETAERFSGWNRAHVPVVAASVSALRETQRDWLPLEALGGADPGTKSLEWVEARTLEGRTQWVPASAVFAPYYPPAGLFSPFRWCTTGLSAGNSLAEAVAHGISEVVERDALSRYRDGHAGRLLDLASVPPSPVKDLLGRLMAAGVEIFALDLSALSPLPIFSVALFDRHGPEPRLPVSGQGCHRSPLIALQRAVLEAAQSRVVAIQGSREDLTRHATEWLDDDAARAAHWEASRLAAGRGGVSVLGAEPKPVETVGQFLDVQATALRARGFEHVLYVDLTHPKVGIPVAAVIVPGMFDGDDPGTARRPPR